ASSCSASLHPHCTRALESADRFARIGRSEHRGAGHKGISSGLPGIYDGIERDPAVNLEGCPGTMPVEDLAYPPDLVSCAADVALPAKARVDRLHDYHVYSLHDLFHAA